MINLALQLNVMLFLLHLLVPHVGQQVQFRAGGEVGAEKQRGFHWPLMGVTVC